MISLIVIFLITIIYISENLVRANAYKNLKSSVVSAFDEIEVYDGELTIDNDFIIFNNNVHLSVYDDETGFIYGDIPLDFEYDETFSDKNDVRIIKHKNKKWYIFVHHYLYDLLFDEEKENNLLLNFNMLEASVLASYEKPNQKYIGLS